MTLRKEKEMKDRKVRGYAVLDTRINQFVMDIMARTREHAEAAIRQHCGICSTDCFKIVEVEPVSEDKAAK